MVVENILLSATKKGRSMNYFEILDDIIFDWLPNATDDEIDDYFFDID